MLTEQNKKYNVLIVDDSFSCRKVAELKLNQIYGDKINLMSTDNGTTALDLVKNSMKNGGIDLVLMDINMSGIDGYETRNQMLKKYNEQGKTPPIFIAYTADVMRDSLNKIIESGFNGYIPKPAMGEHYETLDKYLN